MSASPTPLLDELLVGGRSRHATGRVVGSIVAAGAIVGSSVLLPRIGPNIAPVDPLLVAVIILGLASGRNGLDTPAQRLLRSMAPWLALIAASSVLALTTVGVTSWALVNLGQSAYVVALFVGAYSLFWGPRVDRRSLVWATGAAIVVVTAGLLVTWEPPSRASGTFYHPNYPGHFLAMALIVWWRASRGMPRTRAGVAAVGGAGVVLTGSFGALLMLAVAGAPSGLALLRRRTWIVPAVTAGILLAPILVEVSALNAAVSELAVTRTLSADRFERSQASRLGLWAGALEATAQHPLGMGPMGFKSDADLSGKGLTGDGRRAHNLYLSYLVDRGPVGLFALLGLGVALWRHAPAGGTARLLLLAIAASNLVRETSHYRHMWLFLALALTLDQAAEARDRGRAS